MRGVLVNDYDELDYDDRICEVCVCYVSCCGGVLYPNNECSHSWDVSVFESLPCEETDEDGGDCCRIGRG